ncbi:MAG: DUF6064 family protein, partial [Pseudomonadota bacterium]
MNGEDWLSYRLSDFVMFSERAYQRQIQLYNESWFGLQALALILGAVILWQVLRPSEKSVRVIPILLAMAWFWVAWSFLWARYAEINLFALYAAPAFAVQGLAFLAVAALPNGLRMALPSGLLKLPVVLLLLLTLLLYPLLAPLTGKTLMRAEAFALLPDPTALATLALLSLCIGPVRWPLMVIPFVWCL